MVERPVWERDWRHVSGRWPKGLYMWVCVNCGDRVDAVIAFNRRVWPGEMRTRRHARHWDKIQRLVAEQQLEVG